MHSVFFNSIIISQMRNNCNELTLIKTYIAYTKNTGLANMASPVAYLGRYSSLT